ncbi:Putative methyltransferase, partial [Mycoplasmopsis synoviae]
MEFIKNNTMVFDFIFIDPPFIRYDYINDSLKFIQENKSLSEDGEIILHTDDYRQVVVPEKLKIYKEKRYGKKFIYFIVW